MLTELTLDSCVMGELAVVKCLSCLGGLRSLRIKEDRFNDYFWSALTFTQTRDSPGPNGDPGSLDAPRNICPELQTLNLEGYERCSVSVVAEMVLSRFKFSTDGDRVSASKRKYKRLEKLQLTSVLPSGNPDALMEYPGIRACINAGLDIQGKDW